MGDFEPFYRIEYPPAVAMAYALTGDAAAAEALAQDAFYSAHRQWDRVSRIDPPGEWIRDEVRRLADSRFRRVRAALRARFQRPAPTFHMARRDDEAVWEQVSRLPVKERHAIALHHVGGLAAAQVGELVGEEPEDGERILRDAAQEVHKRLLMQGWSHRDPIVDTQADLLAAARRVVRPEFAAVIASRKRLIRIAVGLAAGVAVVLAGVLVLRDGSSEEPPATVAGGPVTSTFLLLDGRALTLTSGYPLVIDSYSFFLTAPELRGRRAVMIARVEDLPALAESETAQRDEQIDDGVTVWQAEREGRPVFMSIDLGDWAVWVNIGEYDTRPDDEALLTVVERLFGAVSARGVILLSTQPEFYEARLDAGNDQLVTIRVHACRNEEVAGSQLLVDPLRGDLIRAARYASWCDPDRNIEVVLEGPALFVGDLVATLELDIIDSDT